ncbi:mannosyl-oligosaccharide glucosidase [Anthonomus grandis grandis]|uniref:mannosyl-oligosaccharide glucosidase n=1 Tax=Anthonomus grandis grandis TaxID=2921223 RepID=UPI0021659FA7|nr:mannosyl-oligosaccharide glucosidase [Anthonomus grandis grandis]
MARQRKTVSESNKESKSRNSSSSNGSSSPQSKTPQSKSVFIYWKQVAMVLVLGVTVVFAIMGYLQTRVNTPFDDKKVIVKSGLKVPEQFWGTYRPGVYFGLKTRDPHSLVTGLMWYFPNRLGPGGDGIRHWCEQGDNLRKYGWLQHDGSNFGVQEIEDAPFKLTTSFVKRSGGQHGGEWTARITADVLPEYQNKVPKSERISLIWYAALDKDTEGFLAPTNSNTDLTGIRGETSGLGQFKMTLFPQQGTVDHESYLSTVVPGLDLLKETVINSLRLDPGGPRKIVLGGAIDPPGGPNGVPNLVATQITAKLPFSIDIVFESKSVANVPERLLGDSYTKSLEWLRTRFDQRFEDTFGLKSKGYHAKHIEFAQAALSNMIGGIGYFYGSSLVQSRYNEEPVSYWRAPLYTAVPSRSFFPRGFLWDEGFHGLLISQWDLDIELDIMGHWFDLMNAEGWIPREQILGVEARAKVPKEFVVQWNTNANPPTFFLTLEYILNKYEEQLTNERLAHLERLYPRLQAWFQWFNSTQKGALAGSYRWRGRDYLTNKELNPKTLTSGLDDFPRSSHPSDLERHVDLYCWMAVASNTMARLAYLLGRDTYAKYKQTASYLMDNGLMDELHWSNFSKRYADYGLHTDAVKLVRPKPLPRQQNQNLEMVREVLKRPEYRLVDSHFGYVNVFPFLLRVLEPTSPHLGQILKDIRRPDYLWSDYGLRSLSKTSPLYMRRNTEHDPPYWRGQVWINMNFLAARSLWHYGQLEGPYRTVARELFEELRTNVVNNVVDQYFKTGYVWEQYSDVTGEGSGCRPFTGWSALTVILMSGGFE